MIDQINGPKLQVGSNDNGGVHLRRSVRIDFSNRRELATKLLKLLRVACDDTGNQPVEQSAPWQAQYAHFERAIQFLRERGFSHAQGIFAQACVGPDQSIGAAAEIDMYELGQPRRCSDLGQHKPVQRCLERGRSPFLKKLYGALEVSVLGLPGADCSTGWLPVSSQATRNNFSSFVASSRLLEKSMRTLRRR